MKFYSSWIALAIILLTTQLVNAQENSSIVFTYDKSGRLIERKVQVMAGGRIGNFNASKDSVAHNFKVFPNPTNDYLNIEGELPDHFTKGDMILVNNNGQVVKTDTYTGTSKTLSVSGLAPGIYMLEMRYSKKKKDTYKIIVTN